MFQKLHLPISDESWIVLFVLGLVLTGLGAAYRQHPVFETPGHWTNVVAWIVFHAGRGAVALAVFIVVGTVVSDLIQ